MPKLSFMPRRVNAIKRESKGDEELSLATATAQTGGCNLVIDNEQLRAPGVEGLFHLDRAVGYQTLHGDAYKLVDDNLLAALGQMLSQFADITSGKMRLTRDMSWSSLMEVFAQSPFFQKDGSPIEVLENFEAHNTQLSRKLGNFWKKRTEILQNHIKKSKETTSRLALDWFQQTLVKDPNIRESVKLDIKHVMKEQTNTILDLIRGTGETGQRHKVLAGAGLGSLSDEDGNDKCEKVFLDIGVLRFPDFQDPYVQVYRIQLTAWTEINLNDLQVKSGVKGVYHSCQFRPRAAFLKEFQQEALDLAKAKAIDCLFQRSGSATPDDVTIDTLTA